MNPYTHPLKYSLSVTSINENTAQSYEFFKKFPNGTNLQNETRK